MKENLKNFVAEDLLAVNQLILSLAAESNSILIPDITEYISNAGGKRLRPMLTLFFAIFSGYKGTHHINLAASVELIHTATLLHDDVIDQSQTRRGQPTANQKWDNKAPILVGDFLFSLAFKLMVETGNLSALDMLSRAAATISQAEISQLEMIANLDLSIGEYMELITGKTAVLFAASCAAGATLGDKITVEDAYNYGLILGLIFQIVDDLLDYFAVDSRFGKVLGNDLKEKKVTLPIILLIEAEPKLKDYFASLFRKNDIDQEDYETVHNLLIKHQIKEKSFDIIDNHHSLNSISSLIQKFEKSNIDVNFVTTLSALLEEIKHRLF